MNTGDWFNNAFKMKIVGIRPVNITGPDKTEVQWTMYSVSPCRPRGQPVQFPFRDASRIIMHG
jgi:hypothetical protein